MGANKRPATERPLPLAARCELRAIEYPGVTRDTTLRLPQGRRMPARPHRDGIPVASFVPHVIASWRSLPLAPWLPATRRVPARSNPRCHACHLAPRLCVLPSRDRAQSPSGARSLVRALPLSGLCINPNFLFAISLPIARPPRLIGPFPAPPFLHYVPPLGFQSSFPNPSASAHSLEPRRILCLSISPAMHPPPATYCSRTLPPRSRFPNAGHARTPARAPSARHRTDHSPPQVQRAPFYCIDPGLVVQPRIFPLKRHT